MARFESVSLLLAELSQYTWSVFPWVAGISFPSGSHALKYELMKVTCFDHLTHYKVGEVCLARQSREKEPACSVILRSDLHLRLVVVVM